MSDLHSNEDQGNLQEKPPRAQEESLEESSFSLLVIDTKTMHNFDKSSRVASRRIDGLLHPSLSLQGIGCSLEK